MYIAPRTSDAAPEPASLAQRDTARQSPRGNALTLEALQRLYKQPYDISGPYGFVAKPANRLQAGDRVRFETVPKTVSPSAAGL